MPPKEPTLRVCEAALLTLGQPREALADATALDPAALAWPVARGLLNRATLGALAEEGGYDPAAPPPGRVLAGSRSEAIRALLEGLEGSEEVAVKEGPVVAALAGWVRAALDVREASAARRKREKEEAEAKAAAEKEEAEARAAAEKEAAEAAAEAAAAAAEGGGEEGGEE